MSAGLWGERRMVGIVGAEGAKFTRLGEVEARAAIRALLADEGAVAVSGHCHLGGVDIWAEEEAEALGRETVVFPPKTLAWSSGYKPRNLQIARNSDIVHVIVVARYPDGFDGMRFGGCYHCGDLRPRHIKSGGCWTANQAALIGTEARWHVVPNEEG